MTSNGGEYRFDGLTPGAYSLTLDTPPGDIAYPPSARLEIPASRACASQPFSLTDNGRIAGRVVNSKGVPPVGLSVEVVTAGNIPVPRGIYPRTALVTDDGSFEAGELPPGDYVVGVNLIDLPNPGVPYTRLLYPGRTIPGTVTVKAGERVDLGTWQLPDPAPAWLVSGVVAWEDGRPRGGNRDPRARRHRRRANPTTRPGAPSPDRTAALRSGYGRDTATASWPHPPQIELMLVAAPALDLGDRPPSPMRIVIRLAR